MSSLLVGPPGSHTSSLSSCSFLLLNLYGEVDITGSSQCLLFLAHYIMLFNACTLAVAELVLAAAG
eukprot:7564580-Ditylum_brightwellii.AAC.1